MAENASFLSWLKFCQFRSNSLQTCIACWATQKTKTEGVAFLQTQLSFYETRPKKRSFTPPRAHKYNGWKAVLAGSQSKKIDVIPHESKVGNLLDCGDAIEGHILRSSKIEVRTSSAEISALFFFLSDGWILLIRIWSQMSTVNHHTFTRQFQN